MSKKEIMYIELKSGYSDNGPAWIGRVKYSKSGQTVYFNDRAFCKGSGHYYGNYTDAETGEAYWISGVKQNGGDRHWAGSGKITVQRLAAAEYMELVGLSALDPRRYTIEDIPEVYPVERIAALANRKYPDAEEDA
ncbi:MAG: mannose-1-phosphate guanylyltransferase [Oscillospiraceae bacterium]